MKAVIYLFLFAICLFGLSFTNGFFDDPIADLKAKLNTYIKYSPPEKTYLQTDKPYYTSGDTIWFQAYLVEGIFHLPSNRSKNIYVELIDPKDSIIASRTLLPVNGGMGGDIPIPDDAEQGMYLLRAYTNYMRNQATAYFFQKELRVWKQVLDASDREFDTTDVGVVEKQETAQVERPLVEFFPEGGDLVADLRTVVGIKVTTESGSPITSEGKIIDDTETEVMQFKTYDMGIGTFSFLPELDKRYTAVLTVDGVEQLYPLPSVLKKGYILNIRNLGDKISIRAKTNIPKGLEGAFVIGHLRGAPFVEFVHENSQDELASVFSTAPLQDGVATFTLFTSSGEPVCERLVFINNPNDDLQVEVSTDQAAYGTRKPVNVKIALNDTSMDSIFAQVSIAVTDRASVQQSPYAENIKTWLLLNSDLRGAVDNPAYYFEKPINRRRQYLLDALMLTQGWRRFVWKELPSDSTTALPYTPEKGFTISGKTTKLNRVDQPTPSNLYLNFTDNIFTVDETKANANGKFKFGPYIILDTATAFLQARIPPKKTKKRKKEGELQGNRNLSILIDEPPALPKVQRIEQSYSPINTSDEWLNRFLTTSKEQKKLNAQYDMRTIELEEFTVVAKRKEKTVYDDIVASRALYFSPSNRIIVDSLAYGQSAMSVFDLLQNVPGVRIGGAFPNQTAIIRGPSSLNANNTPTYLLNGAVVTEDLIQTLPVQDIYFIDVLKGAQAAIYGIRGATGVIAIYNRVGTGVPTSAIVRQPGILNLTHPGYYKTRQFYAPDYSAQKEIHIKPDYRTTLFWKSNVMLANEKDSISFFTSDQASSYQIVVEGITLEGRVVRGTSSFDVINR